jgi:hypothetical protein
MLSHRSAAITVVLAIAILPQAPRPVTIIAYGDMRFTDPSNVTAMDPVARTALVARIAEEAPDAVLLNGDVPWHGGTVADYDQYRVETAIWRTKRLRVFPAIGNHEFSQCEPEVCIEHWWSAFPELRGKRWYSAEISPDVRVIALDTMSPLVPDSEQIAWLAHELTSLPAATKFVLFTLHHPPVGDVQTRVLVDHNPRPNEIALADFLTRIAPSVRARFVVVAGHVHNYERQERDGIVYLVSGGGGAKPYEIDRTPDDLYKGIEFPNYHYVKFTVAGNVLKGEMYRLDEPTAPLRHYTVKDTFELVARRDANPVDQHDTVPGVDRIDR